jgi:integrase
MPRHSEPFTLIKKPPSPYWHFKLRGWTSYKTTGEKTKTEAMKVVQEALQHQNFNSGKPVDLTFREYAQPYFIWETCPRVQRKLYEESTIGKTHVQKSRMWLEKYVFTDKQFCKLRMFEIRRHHILDFKKRLINKIGLCNTVNKVRDMIRTIFSEAFLREEIPRNPAIRIGNVKYDTIKRCVFSTDEIKLMFRECPGAWGDLLTYTLFYTAAFTGMRRNEILALMWDKTLLRDSIFLIHRAWKGKTGEEIKPKVVDGIEKEHILQYNNLSKYLQRGECSESI